MINRTLVVELVEKYDIGLLEQHFLHSFIIQNGIDFSGSVLLRSYFQGFQRDPVLYLKISSVEFRLLKDLENHLELLIPEKDKKLNGAFFTPSYVVDFIIEQIAPKEKAANLDLSCGCGAFLVGLVNYYKNNYGKSIRAILAENIFGVDILPYNIQRAKLMLALLGLQYDEIIEEKDFNLICCDSLRMRWEQQFDNIIGNPPYVKFQDLSEENRQFLFEKWQSVQNGTFNLYFAFFELGYKLLNDRGKLGFITPNNYFTSLSGEPLRRFFQQHQCVHRILDFHHKKVFDVQTYTAITFLEKTANEAIFFDRIAENQTPDEFLAKANGSPNLLANLNAKKWRLLKSNEQHNIQKIENAGIPIGKIFDINVGIATLKDELYFVDGARERGDYYLKTLEKGTFLIEKEICRSVYKISDFKQPADIAGNTRKIIFPYCVKSGSAAAIPENEFARKFPKCFEYLLAFKEELTLRDKGKVKFQPFYAYGRTQGLAKTGIKILTPTFSKYPRFLLVEDEKALFTNGYGIYWQSSPNAGLFEEPRHILNQIENIDIALKILNSGIMHYYVSKTSVAIEGGYPCYQKNFIEKFSIPDFTKAEIAELRLLNAPPIIDEFLADKYHLKLETPNLVS